MNRSRFHKKLVTGERVAMSIGEQLTDIPPGSNPFHHDLFHMGVDISNDYLVMLNSPSPNQYLILINKTTGQRFQVDFTPEKPTELDILWVEPEKDTILGQELFIYKREVDYENDKVTYRGVDGDDIRTREEFDTLWIIMRGYAIRLGLMNHAEEFKAAWRDDSYAEDFTDEELETLYGQIVDATPNCDFMYAADRARLNDPNRVTPWKFYIPTAL